MAKILLIEDNEDNRDMLARRLTRRGHEVTIAIDGAQGLSMARTEEPEVVLMDLDLPEIDGWEVTRRLKGAPETAGVPIIALTAHAMDGDREKAIETGCDDYASKPVEFQQLLSKIGALLEGSG